MEVVLIFSALSLGLASGFHCIGMCGPIALSMGFSKKQALHYYLHNLSYQIGRISTYAFLGALLGLVGSGFQMAGLQRTLSIGVGVSLIFMALFSFGGKDFANKIPFLTPFLVFVKVKLGNLLTKADYRSRFTTGILNGFLPCGMVYMALTASMASGGVWQGAVFMALFGLGTFPFMFAIVLLGTVIQLSLRQKIVKIIPIIMILFGILFILRGMELGIPYLSPASLSIQSTGADCH